MHTKSNTVRGKLLSQYVLARINDMKGIDLNLYDFDRHNAVYYFATNYNEDLYFRYGGRDSKAADTYLNLDSLELALVAGIKKHKLFLKKKYHSQAKEKPRLARDIPGLRENVIQKNRCVECHHIAHFETTVAEKLGLLDKMSKMFVSPDIKTLGIYLDIPKGLKIANAEGAARTAGLKAGDLITGLNSKSVLTFGDFQYYFNEIDRHSKSLKINILRDNRIYTLRIMLNKTWWVTDLSYRYLTVNPLVFFEEKALTIEQKKALNLNSGSLASRVTKVPIDAILESSHKLRAGDIITAVDGKKKNSSGLSAKLHIKLYHRSGDTVILDIIRNNKPLKISLKTKRKVFRRVED